MMHLEEIKQRHGQDRWKDLVFIAGALLLTALSIGSVTSQARGRAPDHSWKLTVLEGNLEVGQTANQPR